MSLAELAAFGRYAAGLRSYLNRPLPQTHCRRRVEEQLRTRDAHFLKMVERVYAAPRSPYRALLDQAGVEQGDVARLVGEQAVEGALTRLHEAGVYVTLEEFKGKRPITRPGLTLPVQPSEFDNPVPGAAFPGRTGGSRGEGRRLLIDLEHLEHEAVYHGLFDAVLDPDGRPFALWRPAPPAYAGIYYALGFAKLGRKLERWFSQSRFSPRSGGLREYQATLYTLLMSRRTRTPIPSPEHTPVAEAASVARWLAEKRRQGTPGRLNTTASSGVRVALAAKEAGLDVEGSLFVLGGEPLTEAKARSVAEVGARAVCGYYMTEVGRIGITCGAPAAVDDVHVATDKLALVQRERAVGTNGARVGAFLLTTLLPSCPKVMLNVETDDYGVIGERDCGCPIGEIGLRLHLCRIRSYEKLTSEGMSFLGSDLLSLVEEILPARFGGSSIDYQLVEEEVDGLPRVSIVVSPRVGVIDEAELVATALRALGTGAGYKRMMSDIWRAGETLRVVRQEPYATSALKVMPLHVLSRR